MRREFRLTRSADFKRVRETGKAVYHPLLVLVYAANNLPHPRIAVVTSKTIGNAVTRNFIKRRLKSGIEKYFTRVSSSSDLVFYARRDILKASYLEILTAIENLLARADLMEN